MAGQGLFVKREVLEKEKESASVSAKLRRDKSVSAKLRRDKSGGRR
jgi:hypothetical protein